MVGLWDKVQEDDKVLLNWCYRDRLWSNT